MASGAGKSAAFFLLVLNLIMYLIVIIMSAWSVNHGIVRARQTASLMEIPARIFPIYFPFGNLATGFFVIFALIAGVVGFVSCASGINNVMQWTASSLHSAAAYAIVTWSLTLLAMGFACKEIDLGWTDSHLRTLEVIIIILSGTQLLCMGAIYLGVEDPVTKQRPGVARV